MQTTWTVADYAESADIVVTFESDAGAYRTMYTPPLWLADYPVERFAHIVHSESSASQMLSGMRLAISRKAGVVYFTDDLLPNPYDELPPYWGEEVSEALGLIFADGFESGDVSAWAP